MKKALKYIIPVILLLIILGGVVFLVDKNTTDSGITKGDKISSQEVISEDRQFEEATSVLLAQDNQNLQNAVNAMSTGDFKKSVADFESLVASGQFSGTDLQSLQSLLIYSYLAYGSVYYEESMHASKARELLASSGISQETWFYNYYSGYSYEIENNFDKAIEYYTIALNFGDTLRQAQTLNQLGHTYDLSGDSDKAFYYYTQAYNKNPEDIQVNLNLGRIYSRKGDIEKAKGYFEDIVDKVEDKTLKSEVYFNLSTIALYSNPNVLEGTEESSLYAEKTIKENPDYPFGYLARARIFIFLGVNLAGAESDLDKSLELYENFSDAYEWKGKLAQSRNNHNKAIEYFQKSSDLLSDNITLMKSELPYLQSHLHYLTAYSYAILQNKEETLKNLKIFLEKPDILSIELFFKEIDNNQGVFGFLSGDVYFDELINKIPKK